MQNQDRAPSRRRRDRGVMASRILTTRSGSTNLPSGRNTPHIPHIPLILSTDLETDHPAQLGRHPRARNAPPSSRRSSPIANAGESRSAGIRAVSRSEFAFSWSTTIEPSCCRINSGDYSGSFQVSRKRANFICSRTAAESTPAMYLLAAVITTFGRRTHQLMRRYDQP